MKIIPFVVALFFSLTPARADLILVQKKSWSSSSQTETTTIKGHKLRSDIEMLFGGMNHFSLTIIVDADAGLRVFSWNHSDHYTRITMPSNMPKWEDYKVSAYPRKDTGRSERLGTNDAEIFTLSSTNFTMMYWVVKDFPKYADLISGMDEMNHLLEGLEGYEQFNPSIEGLPGMVAKETLTNAHGEISTTELISVSDSPVDDSVFQFPHP